MSASMHYLIGILLFPKIPIYKRKFRNRLSTPQFGRVVGGNVSVIYGNSGVLLCVILNETQ